MKSLRNFQHHIDVINAMRQEWHQTKTALHHITTRLETIHDKNMPTNYAIYEL